jgi:hypothetical protein
MAGHLSVDNLPARTCRSHHFEYRDFGEFQHPACLCHPAAAMKGHILGEAHLMGTYQKKV